VTDEPVSDEPVSEQADGEFEEVAGVADTEDLADAEPAAEPVIEEPANEESASEEPAAEVPATSNEGQAPIATAVLTHVVRSIVDDADAVRVDAVDGRNRLKLEVKVGPGDLGRVIGRRGRTAQSIRTVVRAAATRDGVEVDVDFVD
jgi:uncharacterized protein